MIGKSLTFTNRVTWIAVLTLYQGYDFYYPFVTSSELILVRIITEEDHTGFEATLLITTPTGKKLKAEGFSSENRVETCLPSAYFSTGGIYTLSVELRSNETIKILEPIKIKVYDHEG